MSDDRIEQRQIEQRLIDARIRSIPAERQVATLRAILTSAAPRPATWWRRPIPLWKAAACVALATAAALGLRGRTGESRPDAPNSIVPVQVRDEPQRVVVKLDTPIFESPSAASGRLDVARWRSK